MKYIIVGRYWVGEGESERYVFPQTFDNKEDVIRAVALLKSIREKETDDIHAEYWYELTPMGA